MNSRTLLSVGLVLASATLGGCAADATGSGEEIATNDSALTNVDVHFCTSRPSNTSTSCPGGSEIFAPFTAQQVEYGEKLFALAVVKPSAKDQGYSISRLVLDGSRTYNADRFGHAYIYEFPTMGEGTHSLVIHYANERGGISQETQSFTISDSTPPVSIELCKSPPTTTGACPSGQRVAVLNPYTAIDFDRKNKLFMIARARRDRKVTYMQLDSGSTWENGVENTAYGITRDYGTNSQLQYASIDYTALAAGAHGVTVSTRNLAAADWRQETLAFTVR